jgi:hypothetical protein
LDRDDVKFIFQDILLNVKTDKSLGYARIGQLKWAFKQSAQG